MRPHRLRPALLGVLAAALLVGGCSGGSADPFPGSTSSPAPSRSSSSPAPSSPSDPDGDAAAIAASPACDEVRAGIGAFNARDYDETVSRFEAAVPLARRAAARSQSLAATALLDAVTYYAQLAPEDYLDAAASSPEFERNKQITLGLCGDGEPVPGPQASPTGRVLEA